MQLLSYGLFLFVLVFCPLAFGTVENWSRTVLTIATTVSFLLLSFRLFNKNETFFKIPGIIPLFLLLAWMLLQLLPLPASIVRVISPSTFALYSPFLELEPSQQWIPLTVNPGASLLLFFTFSSYALFYILTVYHLSSGNKLKQTLIIITTLASIIGVEAILQKLTSPEAIYWFRTTPSSSPMGPWVYRNHFAGFMEMLFPLVIALFLFYRPHIQYEQSLKNKFIAAFTMTGANRYLLFGSAAILMAVSILFSLSRGGIITLSIAFLFFIFFSARATQDKRTQWIFFLTISAVLVVTWLGWQPIMDRFGSMWGEDGLNTGGRFPIILDSVAIIKKHPFFGTGFGTFIDTYPTVRTISGSSIYDHAHNDYIELLADGGIVGFVLCGCFVFSILINSIKTLNRRREPYAILITSGALTGLLALLFHSFVDFQMYNGANALYFFFLCGLAVSGANTRYQYRSRPTLLEESKHLAFITPSILALLLLITATTYNYRQSKADQLAAPLQSIFLNHNIPTTRLKEIHQLYAQASNLNPLEAEYTSRMGQVSLLVNRNDIARNNFFQTCMLQPMSGFYLQQLGLSLEDDNKDLKETILTLGIEREPLNIDRYLTYAEWLITRKKRSDALKIIDQAFQRIPEKALELSSYLVTKQFSRSEIEAVISPIPSTWFAFGMRMEKRKQPAEAEFYYLKTFEHPEQGEILPSYFSRLYNLYQRQGEKEKANTILRKAIDHFPEYAPFRVQLGDYYRREGIPYRALEEYQQALILDPESSTARQRLKDNSLQ